MDSEISDDVRYDYQPEPVNYSRMQNTTMSPSSSSVQTGDSHDSSNQENHFKPNASLQACELCADGNIVTGTVFDLTEILVFVNSITREPSFCHRSECERVSKTVPYIYPNAQSESEKLEVDIRAYLECKALIHGNGVFLEIPHVLDNSSKIVFVPKASIAVQTETPKKEETEKEKKDTGKQTMKAGMSSEEKKEKEEDTVTSSLGPVTTQGSSVSGSTSPPHDSDEEKEGENPNPTPLETRQRSTKPNSSLAMLRTFDTITDPSVVPSGKTSSLLAYNPLGELARLEEAFSPNVLSDKFKMVLFTLLMSLSLLLFTLSLFYCFFVLEAPDQNKHNKQQVSSEGTSATSDKEMKRMK